MFPVNRLHWDMMDGARLFPRHDPANCTLMVFQSEALNYSVELTAPAHSLEATTAVQFDFDLTFALCI